MHENEGGNVCSCPKLIYKAMMHTYIQSSVELELDRFSLQCLLDKLGLLLNMNRIETGGGGS